LIVLGICDNHESGAALMVDGKLLGAVNEERLDRNKMSALFPWRSIDWLLADNGLKPGDVDRVVVASTVTPVLFFRIWKEVHERVKRTADQFSYLLNLYILYQVTGRLTRLPLALEGWASRAVLRRRFARRGFSCPVSTIDHHFAHALSAALPSGLDPCLAVTADAMGDGLSLTVSLAEGGRITPVYRQYGFCAINTYYSRVTQHLGFTANRHEGKVVGLAAHGDPSVLRDAFHRQLHFRGKGFNRTPYMLPQHPERGFYALLRKHGREDVAAALQDNLEREFVRFLRLWTDRLKVRKVALAGGLFANVKLNQRLREDCGLEGIYITPNMGDGGLCLGAALSVEGLPEPGLPSFYLGPHYDEASCRKALDDAGLRYQRPDDMAGEVARLLAEGKAVARFDGRMEFGPRALGNRSILYRTDDPAVMDWLNERLDRTEFMPFAPVTLAEHASECYCNTPGSEPTWKYMNLCFDCTEKMKEQSPGVVHVDGTARPQVLSRQDNPAFYDILANYHRITGNPSLLNTSFNLHEEPIIDTPEQAVRSYKQAGLDALVLGPFLAR